MNKGVVYEVFPSDKYSEELFHDIEESLHMWKFSNTTLTIRELEVYKLFGIGITASKEIAKRLRIEKSTVDVHFRKAKQHVQEEEPTLDTRMDIWLYLKRKGYLDMLQTLRKK